MILIVLILSQYCVNLPPVQKVVYFCLLNTTQPGTKCLGRIQGPTTLVRRHTLLYRIKKAVLKESNVARFREVMILLYFPGLGSRIQGSWVGRLKPWLKPIITFIYDFNPKS